MGEILTLGNKAFRDYVTDGVPGTGPNKPSKQEIRDFVSIVDITTMNQQGYIDALQTEVDNLSVSGDVIAVATWAQLNAITGVRANQRATVENDPTSHTGPGGVNVPVSTGVYGWKTTAPIGWVWLSPLVTPDALMLNAGKDYPLKAVPRNNVVSAANFRPVNGLLDIKVLGARTGKLYRLEYYGNGNVTYGYEIRVYEYDAATYYTGVAAGFAIIELGDTPRPTIETGPIVTYTAKSTRVDGMSVQFTVDRTKSDEPNPWALNGSGNPAVASYSWIIDPSCYFPVETPAVITAGGAYGSIAITAIKATKVMTMVWSHGETQMLRLTMGPNGKNGLFNIISYEIADLGDPGTANWIPINSTSTDYFPPLIVQSNGSPVDAGAPQIYTGGNHGSDGSAGGNITAIMSAWVCEIDGRVLGENFSGAAERIVVRWSNDLQAYNTLSMARTVVRQHFMAIINPGSIEFFAEIEALESITVITDNGPQIVPTGYTDYIYYNGQPTTRIPIATAGNSGPKSGYATAWAISLKHATYGFLTAWVNRGYEAGDGRYVTAANPYMRQGGGGNTKQYHAIVSGTSAVLTVGQSYKYQGGYSWGPISLISGGVDSAFVTTMKNLPVVAYAFLAAGSGFLNFAPKYAGMSVGSTSLTPRNRLPLTVGGVAYQLAQIT
ncbi:hypothetical protein V9K92_10290 [Phyllobacterium sp. CCNWLW109]|uniref:hypothetical protein n=1 Tax=Phyllobacterium sp. CCNWLW109 TaxID=3127479 RepID=UPI0030778ADF